MITQVNLHFSFHEIFWVHSSGGKDGLTSDQGVEDIVRGPLIAHVEPALPRPKDC